MTYSIEPVGHVTSPFKEKFAIPRQPSLCKHAFGSIKFSSHIDPLQACDEISQFTHLWLLFIFHKNIDQGFKNKIRPPRLGGNKKIGVFASRSSFRPNHIGMSLVKNEGLVDGELKISGIDLLDQTPIIDIKPYLPYSDMQLDAIAGYAQNSPQNTLNVVFTQLAEQQLLPYLAVNAELKVLIQDVLSQDPRPAYKQNKVDTKIYFIKLYSVEIAWRVSENIVYIESINNDTESNIS